MRKRDRIAALIGCNRLDADHFVRRVNASLAEPASLNQVLRVLRKLPGGKRSPERVIVALGGEPSWKKPAQEARQTLSDFASLQHGIRASKMSLRLLQASQASRRPRLTAGATGRARSDSSDPTWDVQTAVVGVTFEGRQATVACLSRGEEVWLRREPRNRFDANAIRVERANGRQIGYISRYLAAELAPVLDRSPGPVTAIVLAIVGGYYDTSVLGVRIGFNLPVETLKCAHDPASRRFPRRSRS